MNKNYYITTTIPYVNAKPHIGFALEILQADTLARYKRQQGLDVFMNFGTDEHGLKIYRKALEQDKDPQTYVDEYAKKYGKLKKALNLSYDNFIRTTDPEHKRAAQEFWKQCDKNGDIYKKTYKTKYCVGCELEKTDSELEDGRCRFHPGQDVEIIEEENYFFRFSNYQDKLLELYDKNPDFVVPDYRLQEIRNFVKKGLHDFSISRLKAKMPWGINVPDDPDHVMYVWFDALINYVSTIGWPKDKASFNKWWPVVQIAGKDNLRQQSAIWQAMLMSAGLPNSKQVFIHGFITSEGQRISKSIGNTVDPIELVEKYGTDALRYYLLREIPAYGDGDFSERRFKELYNADLANGLGNLVARVAKLCEKIPQNYTIKQLHYVFEKDKVPNIRFSDYENKYFDALNRFAFHEALAAIWHEIRALDGDIERVRPWEYAKKPERKHEIEKFLFSKVERLNAVVRIKAIANYLLPFLPQAAEKILAQFKGPTIKSQPPLFPRI